MFDEKLRSETLAIHAGKFKSTTGSCATPIFQTASFLFENTEDAAAKFALKKDGNIYTRMGNPTNEVLEKRIAALEGGVAAVATTSGMSAIFLTIATLARAGDHIVASASLYGGTETLFRYTLSKFGIEVTFVENLNAENLKNAIQKNTRAIYFETIGNPKGDVLDFEKISIAAHAESIPVIIDNTFAPIICRPFEFGANIVIHSSTKWIGGHGTSIGGVLVDGGNFNWNNNPEFTKPDESYGGIKFFEKFGANAFAVKARVEGLRNLGMCSSPFNSWQILQGAETLPLRIERHSANTLALAEWLERHERVEWVNYIGLPDHSSHALAKKYLRGGFGGVLSFGVHGGKPAGEKFINSVRLASHLANVGDAKTLVIHPASTTHAQSSPEALALAGVQPETIRVSVGLENIADICADFEQALSQ